MIVFFPLWVGAGALVYIGGFSDFPQQLYAGSLMNIYYDCAQVVDAPYVYKMKPGKCLLNNIEFSTVLTHDRTGFRNQDGMISGHEVLVLGDSHAHGFGVQDEQTFAHILDHEFGYRTRNLAMGSYATTRELEVLKANSETESAIVLQYCSNDFAENIQSEKLELEEYAGIVRKLYQQGIERYHATKAVGISFPLRYAAQLIVGGQIQDRSRFYDDGMNRDVEEEAEVFGRLMSRYRSLLEGKRVVVFESSGHGRNAKAFQRQFSRSLLRHVPGVDFRILDLAKFLGTDDYYFLDGHLTPAGHRKIAVELAAALGRPQASAAGSVNKTKAASF